MKKFLKWFNKNILYFVYLVIFIGLVYGLFLQVDNNKLKEQNTQLKEKLVVVEKEAEYNSNLVIERNNEIYLLKMERDEWKELFYAEIDFHPYEGPDW